MSDKNIQKENNIIDDTKNKITVIDGGISTFEKFLNIVKNNSIWVLLKTFLMLIFFGITFFFILNPTYFFEKYEEYTKKRHESELVERFNNTQLMSDELNEMLYELHADRTFFIEYHNSVKSLQGAPFAYGSMSFEKLHPNRELVFIADEYTDFPLTKYDMVIHLYGEEMFVGTINELELIDKRLAGKLKISNITQVALIEVWGDNQPLGILGATWSEHEVLTEYKDKIEKIMHQRSSRIRILLN